MGVNAPGNTGPQSKIIAWCGLSIDSRDSTVYSAAGGGHTDYAGNEVDSIRLSDDAPAWVERRASTSSGQITASATHYADGRPTSRHTYYGAVMNEIRNRVMVMAGSRYGDGYQISSMDGFNISSNDWDSAGTFPDTPGAVPSYYGATIVEDKRTGDVYALANYGVFQWVSSSNSWATRASNTGIWGFEAASALDTRRNRILVLGGDGNDHGMYTLGASSAQSVSISGSAAGNVNGGGNGMVYDPWMDAFLVKTPSGSTVYAIDASTLTATTLSTTTASGSIPSSDNGVYRRFLFAPNLGGVVYVPDFGTNMWFLRTV